MTLFLLKKKQQRQQQKQQQQNKKGDKMTREEDGESRQLAEDSEVVRVKSLSSGAYAGNEGSCSFTTTQVNRVEELEALVKRQRDELELSSRRQAEYETILKRQREEHDATVRRQEEIEMTMRRLLPREDIGPPQIEKEVSLQDHRETTSQANPPPEQRPSISEHPFPEDDEDDWHNPFGESTYTLLYMCPFWSQGFWYSIFVYCLQMATVSLTMVDVIEEDDKDNMLAIPPMVDLTVTCAQGLTIFMLLAYMSDLIEAVLKLQDGFSPEVKEEYSGASFSTWLASCLAQFAAGFLVLVASFILTMQASTVVDLMLNLTALLFIGEIDDLGFAMAAYGFITDNLQQSALKASNFRVPRRRRTNLYRRILYLLTVAFLLVGYGVLKNWQLQGYYLPTYCYVQFGGDDYQATIHYYSGILKSQSGRTVGYREYRDLGTENLLLAYCATEHAWTFSFGDDPCEYFAKSPETTNYNVLSTAESLWHVKDGTLLQPFDSFSLVGRDCDPDVCQGVCGADGLCKCPHDSFGMNCQFSNACPHMMIDDRFPAFPPITSTVLSKTATYNGMAAISDEFELLQNSVTKEYVRVYNMPVWYSSKTFPANIIFYGGRRWILTSEWDLFNLTEAKMEHPDKWFFPEKTVATLENNFHGFYRASYTPLFISDAVDFATPEFVATPIGLSWWQVQEKNRTRRHYEPDAPVTASLICPTAPVSCLGKPDSFCGEFGECDTNTKLCACFGGYSGERCEIEQACYDQEFIPCSGHGICGDNGICRCNAPYFGKLCTNHHKCYEDKGSCLHGGVCNMTTGDCDCPDDPTISGVACEMVANCDVFGCKNGGVCGLYGACFCHPPFYGTHCHLLNTSMTEFFCSTSADCHNGSCNVATGLCDCHEGWYGTLCEHRYNCTLPEFEALLIEPCANGGVCNDTTGTCQCQDPFFGHDCSEVPPCSSDDECLDDIWFENTCNIDSGKCDCFHGLVQGDRCEKPGICTSDEDCYNKGVCSPGGEVCECPTGFGGHLCQYVLIGTYKSDYDVLQEWLEEEYKLGNIP